MSTQFNTWSINHYSQLLFVKITRFLGAKDNQSLIFVKPRNVIAYHPKFMQYTIYE